MLREAHAAMPPAIRTRFETFPVMIYMQLTMRAHCHAKSPTRVCAQDQNAPRIEGWHAARIGVSLADAPRTLNH